MPYKQSVEGLSLDPSGPLFSMGQAWRDINGAAAADQFSATQSQIQRDFEERMSNTAYQRAVADMKAAGLNPAMMYGGGGAGPASTPSGASARASNADGAGFLGLLGRLVVVAATRGLASRVYSSVASASSVGAAADAARTAVNVADRGFLRSKPFAFDAMGKRGLGRFVASVLSTARSSYSGVPLLDVSLDSLLK